MYVTSNVLVSARKLRVCVWFRLRLTAQADGFPCKGAQHAVPMEAFLRWAFLIYNLPVHCVSRKKHFAKHNTAPTGEFANPS